MESIIDAAFVVMFLLCFGLCVLGMLRGVRRGLLAGGRPCALASLSAQKEQRIESLRAERDRLDALIAEAEREDARPSLAPRHQRAKEGHA